MRAAFTPGPWHADFDEVFRIREADGSSIAYTQFVHLRGRRDTEEVVANARLIAAAPELYEAALLVVNDPCSADNLALLEAAVAKARSDA